MRLNPHGEERVFARLEPSAPNPDTAFLRDAASRFWRTPDGYDVYAPDRFDDVAVRPNRSANFSAANYTAKAARWKALWPEVTVLAADIV